MQGNRIILERKLKAGFRHLLVLVALLLSVSTFSQTLAQSYTAAGANTSGPAAAPTGYADVVSRVTPAVVTVRSQRTARAAQNPLLDDPTLREFFGDRIPQFPQEGRGRRQRGLGSGVIVTADGYILTNNHVVEDAEQIRVELTDGRTLTAKVVGTDPPSDLAVLKVDAGGLPVLPLGDSERVRVGDIVLAVGNPLGIGQTVTSGIISAKGRSTGFADGSYEDFLQTDAPINQGNSGGALVNTRGELVGINSQILSPSGGSIGIGFAIPSNMARSVMDQLVKTGKVRRGQLGIVVQKVTPEMAQSLGMSAPRGLIVSQVQPGSAAERAGIRRGDLIVSLNGTPAADPNTFRNTVAGITPGTQVTLSTMRGGTEQQVHAVLGESQPRGAEQRKTEESAKEGETGQLGITVSPLTPELVTQFELPQGTEGLLVREVDPNGPAAEAGLRRGDVIEQVNQQPVTTGAQLKAAIGRAGSRPTLLLVNRQGTTLFLTVQGRPAGD
ncbi:MAG TPA: DegQ family serine endoprotease [Pyrinomonadaceae bacterium]|nr:DegQ family serine endoprotease [Pyrinomonadaceae bacterium]